MVRWFRWRREPNYEQELPRLSRQIKEVRSRALLVHGQQRRWPFIFLLQALPIYLAYVAYSTIMSLYLYPKHSAALALSPVLIFFVHRAIIRVVTWRKSRLDARLSVLSNRRQKLVDDYKKKTRFDEIQKLIADPAEQQDSAEGKQSQRNRSGGNRAAQGPAAGSANSASAENRENRASRSDLPGGQDPVPVYHTSWVDRVLDLLIGENEQSPANRFALICPNCHAHNGLAPYGKTAEEVVYKCPVCGRLNGSPDARLGLEKAEKGNELKANEAELKADTKDDALVRKGEALKDTDALQPSSSSSSDSSTSPVVVKKSEKSAFGPDGSSTSVAGSPPTEEKAKVPILRHRKE